MDPITARPYNSTSGGLPNEMDMNLSPKSQRKLEATDLPSMRRLGKGLSGFIYETTWDGNKYARKDFPLRSVKHVIFEKEVSVLLNLVHPNVVKCFGYTVGRSSCSLLQEYVNDDLQNTMQRRIEAHRKKNSTSTSRSRVLAVDDMKSLLYNKVKERDSTRVDEGSSRLPGIGGAVPFEMSEAVEIISQIATGMKYLHDNQVVHGDLKTKNVLVCSESGETKVKVADFGLIETKKMIKLVSKRTQHFEILMWKAPELLEEFLGPITEDSDDPFTDSDTDEDVTFGSHDDESFKFLAMADVYSFGLTCSHILGGKLLFPGLSLTQLRKQRIHGFKPELPTDCPAYLKFMIGSCLQIVALSRPTFSAICKRFSTSKARLSHNPLLMDLMKDSEDFNAGSASSLEQMTQVPRALEIIENVQKLSGDVWVNKHQCKRVADRFKAIGVGLNLDFSVGSHGSNDSTNMDYPAFDELLTVLRNGEVLVSKNVQWTGIKDMLTWTDNREAFKEIHEELDTMKAKFSLEGFSGSFETTLGIKRTVILNQDAEKDLEEMKGLSQSLQATEKPEAMDLEKVVKVVLEKTEAKGEPTEDLQSGDLPSYLMFDLSTIIIDSPVWKQEIMSKLESEETRVWASLFNEHFETTQEIRRSVTPTQDAEKDPEEMKRLTETMPISQVPKALEIIERVQKLTGDVWVNKRQCKRLAARFKAFGERLHSEFSGGINSINNQDCRAFYELLKVLRKGEILVSNNTQWDGIKGVLIWTDNREAFKEIHEELDTMKAKFPYGNFTGRFETTEGILRSLLLTGDAEKDLEEMNGLSRIKESQQATEKPEAMDLKKVVKVVLERTEGKSVPTRESDYLPSYLKIDPSTIIIKDPVRKQEISSEQGLEKSQGWAVVFEGSWLGCEFAVKVFKSGNSTWNKYQLLKAVGTLMELRHPHIIRLVGFAQDEQLCAVLMEMMPEKDLRHFMKQRLGRPFTRSEALDIITQIAKGMLYLHTQGYVHGDLKCSKILVKKYEDYIEVKIGGLRHAQKLESAGGSSEINLVRRPRWTPQEALDNYGGAKPSDDLLKQADIYSFAMTCYEVVTGEYPFDGIKDDTLREQIKAGMRPELPEDLDSGLRGLIESCWDNNPNMRPVFENICIVLDFIRSSVPGVTDSGWLGRMREFFTESPAQKHVSTWAGNLNDESGVEYVADADAIKVPKLLKINPANLKKVRKIGSGSSAKVYEATWLGCTFAVKRIKKFENDASISALQQELDFLIQLRHPYIIQMVGFSIDKKERCMIVMEYMKGSLKDLIKSRIRKKMTATKTNSSQPAVPFEFHEAVGIITKLAQGMAFLHSRGVMHRDLKSLNVLCQEHAGFIDVKIVDFGVSQHIAASGTNALGVGTGFWRAPEILPTVVNRSRKSDVNLMAADVYSFAMTCYEILTGGVPFEEYGLRITECDEVVKGLRPSLPPYLDAGLKKVITDCWRTDPEERPDFADICTRLNTLLHC